jgi:hypothetical protein
VGKAFGGRTSQHDLHFATALVAGSATSIERFQITRSNSQA